MKVKSGVPGSRVSEGGRYALLILPPAAVMIVLFAYPFAGLLRTSFAAPNGILGYYLGLLRDPLFRISLWNTLVYSLVTGAGTAVLGYPVALLLASVRPTVSGVLLLLVMFPFWTSILVRAYAWIVLLGRQGVLNTALTQIGLIHSPLQLMFNSVGVIIGMIHVMLPYMILPILSAMSRLNKDLLSAADSLGVCRSNSCDRWQSD